MYHKKRFETRRPLIFAPAIFALLILTLLTTTCARFRIQELEPRALFSTTIVRAEDPNPNDAIHLQESGRVPFNLPLRPAVNPSSAYIADSARRMIRVFSAGSADTPEAVLAGDGAAPLPADSEAKPGRINLKMGVPGWLAVDEDDERLYIQSFVRDTAPINRSEQPIENRPSGQTSLIRQVASNVIVIDTENNYRTIGSLGINGLETEPFPEILRLTAEDDGVLHVLYRDAASSGAKPAPGTLHLTTYRRGTPTNRFEVFEEGVATPEELRKYFVEWEDIVPGPDGAFAIYSVALRQKSSYDLISRRVFRRDGPEATPVELLRIDNPADYFVSSRPDGGFFLMNAEEDGSRILFKTFSPDGEYLNNRLIIFPGLRAAWRETFLSLDGRIFSSRLYLGKFELYEWN